MGLWQHTTYIECESARRVADALVVLLQEEGMRPVTAPPSRGSPEGLGINAMQADIWGVAVFPGAPGWTVIKTAPLELLGDRSPRAQRMRLVDLVERLSVSGFQVNLYDTSSLVLIETDRRGQYLLSGFCPASPRHPDPLLFNQERLVEDRIDVRFELLPFSNLSVITRAMVTQDRISTTTR